MSIPIECAECKMTMYTSPPVKEMLCEKCEENQELKSLSLWTIRRLNKIYKDFAYDEYDKITGEKSERD